MHLIPAGVLRGKKCIIGNGVVIDLEALQKEITELQSLGFDLEGNLFISSGAHLILPDYIEDSKKGKNSSTGRGIAPAYKSKATKEGLRMHDLVGLDHLNGFEAEIRPYIKKNKKYLSNFKGISKYAADTPVIINNAIDKGKNVLFEGAQGTGLDVDHGQYPYVTSSNATSGGACTGTGVGPTKIDRVLGIFKAYTTRVDRDGESPLPTQIDDGVGELLRKEGGEYGATTGRPRRCGWFDAVLAKYAARVNGMTGFVLTKLDVLDVLDEIKICVAYELDGKRTTDFPADGAILRRCKPIYETLKGWKGETVKGKRRFEDLPENAKKYINKIKELLGIPLCLISIDAERNGTIVLREVWGPKRIDIYEKINARRKNRENELQKKLNIF